MTAPPSVRTRRRLAAALDTAIDVGAIRLPDHATLAIAMRRLPVCRLDVHLQGLDPTWAWQPVPRHHGGNGLQNEPTPALTTLVGQISAVTAAFSTPECPISVLTWGRTTPANR